MQVNGRGLSDGRMCVLMYREMKRAFCGCGLPPADVVNLKVGLIGLSLCVRACVRAGACVSVPRGRLKACVKCERDPNSSVSVLNRFSAV